MCHKCVRKSIHNERLLILEREKNSRHNLNPQFWRGFHDIIFFALAKIMEQYQALKVTELKSLIKERNINAKHLKLKKDFINALVEYDKQEELSQRKNEATEISNIDDTFDNLLDNKRELLDFDFDSFDKVENEPITSLNAEEAESEETTSMEEEEDSKDIDEIEYEVKNHIDDNSEVESSNKRDNIEEKEEPLIEEVQEETNNKDSELNNQSNRHKFLNTEPPKPKTISTTPQIRYEEEIRKQNKSMDEGRRSQSIFSDIYYLIKDLIIIFILLSIILPAWMYSRL